MDIQPIETASTAFHHSLLDQTERLAKLTRHRDNPASWTYERLSSIVKEFQDNLDDTQEVGLKIIPLGNLVYYVQDIGYWGPDILMFYCLTPEGAEATLIQHYSQLNFLLTALPKLDPQKPARRIGFDVPDHASEE